MFVCVCYKNGSNNATKLNMETSFLRAMSSNGKRSSRDKTAQPQAPVCAFANCIDLVRDNFEIFLLRADGQLLLQMDSKLTAGYVKLSGREEGNFVKGLSSLHSPMTERLHSNWTEKISRSCCFLQEFSIFRFLFFPAAWPEFKLAAKINFFELGCVMLMSDSSFLPSE